MFTVNGEKKLTFCGFPAFAWLGQFATLGRIIRLSVINSRKLRILFLFLHARLCLCTQKRSTFLPLAQKLWESTSYPSLADWDDSLSPETQTPASYASSSSKKTAILFIRTNVPVG